MREDCQDAVGAAEPCGVMTFDLRRPSALKKHTTACGGAQASKPWRKSAAACKDERAAVRRILRGPDEDASEETARACGVDLGALQTFLRVQGQLDNRSAQEASPQLEELQKAVTALREAATNGARRPAEVHEARQRVEQLANAAGLAVEVRQELSPVAVKLQIMHEVMPRLWLGGWQALDNKCKELDKHGVTHVVSVLSADKRQLPDFIVGHYYAQVDDNEHAANELSAHFRKIVNFIDDALTNGGAVYVHCGAGISRAPTAVAAYMIWKLQLPASTVLNLIRRARPSIRPNIGFARKLKDWEVDVMTM
eukprot:TRINITY_DN29399_c0_g1_i2.p1 TRINITY_DN29399_c0_g1~~TRINITY_DN29399_c0_g1_i2.p1  ORF type:complete len:310 (-),score=53.77 TRINITY_DN29399_c0_g1_i2:243-1172(-)